jgi:predicted ATP-grasp superfamily ATP-dependent carboligase
VRSNDRLLIERYMEGHFIGCDTFSLHGRHQLLGVNEKIMFLPPSFAIKGGCFVPNVGEWPGLERYLFSILDALDFNCGAAHIEVMITPDGPRLVEINPRLVGAKIPKLLSYALGCSAHELLIDLHLGRWPLDRLQPNQFQMAVTRWLVSDAAGVLARIDVPRVLPESIKHFEILTQPGDPVFVPFENAHRLAYVMTAHVDRSLAERAADDFIGQLKINLKNEIAH